MSSLSLLLRLSVRNLARHRRRNLLMLAAIVVAVAVVVLANALVRGMQGDLALGAVENLTGHVKVHAPGYMDDPSIERSFAMPQAQMPELFGLPTNDSVRVQGWAARVRVPAVIMSERETRGIQLVGVDPQQEGISFLGNASIDGKALQSVQDKQVLIGRALAEQLETRVGKRLVIISQGSDGANREAGFRIAGTYDVDGTGIEKTYVFTGREYLQGLLDAPGVTEISVRLQTEPDDWQVQDRLAAYFSNLEVRNWQQLEPQAAAMYVIADTSIFIMFLIMMGALTFGLMNTLITAVMERVKELGLLRALGMRPGTVVAQVVFESLLLMLVGVALGCALGAGLVYWLRDGIDLSRWAEGMEMTGIRSVLVPRLDSADVLLVASLSLLLGLFASLYPARRAVKIKPLDALGR